MKCLVTGGAGFIGSHIVDALINQNHQVTVIDNLSTGKKANVNPKALLVVQDITESLNDLFEKEKFDLVFHLAAQINLRKSLENPMEDAKTNILGSLNVMQACAKHRAKIIFSSTGGAIYDSETPLPCTEQATPNPLSPYGLAKYTIENYLQIMKSLYGLNFVSLRYSNVYGPRQDSHGEAGVIAIFVKKASANEPMNIFGDGLQTRDFVFVQDVVKANLLAAEKLSGIYNVSTNTQISVLDIARKIKEFAKSSSPIIHTAEIKGELKHSRLSFDKIAKVGWHPQVQFSHGLRETVEALR